jgi:hypothetical protein
MGITEVGLKEIRATVATTQADALFPPHLAVSVVDMSTHDVLPVVVS